MLIFSALGAVRASRWQVDFEEAVLVWPPTERALLTVPLDLATLREP